MTIFADSKVIKQQQEQAERNIARGDWEDEFLPDEEVPKSPNPAVAAVLDNFGKTPIQIKR